MKVVSDIVKGLVKIWPRTVEEWKTIVCLLPFTEIWINRNKFCDEEAPLKIAQTTFPALYRNEIFGQIRQSDSFYGFLIQESVSSFPVISLESILANAFQIFAF